MTNDSVRHTKHEMIDKHVMCAANFLLTSTMVMQLVALSELPASVKLDNHSLSVANIAFVAGMFFVGPISAFIVDKFRRQSVFRASLLVAALASSILCGDINVENVAAVRFVDGMCYGIAQITLGSTLLNDLAVSERRTSSDYSFAWAALLAIPSGAYLAYFLMPQFGFDTVVVAGAIMLVISFLSVSRLNVPFRAPIHPDKFSLDRFWQKNDFLPFLNLLLLSVSAGVMIASLSSPLLLAMGAGGIVAAHAVRKAVFRNADVRAEIVAGLVFVCFALLLFILRRSDVSYRVASFMLGAGISMSSARFLLYFLKLTGHCQRGTAQNTYLLSRECGYALGVLLAFSTSASMELALGLTILSAALYLLVTHPWFVRHNDRDFKFREV